jgi:hypothetical protein
MSDIYFSSSDILVISQVCSSPTIKKAQAASSEKWAIEMFHSDETIKIEPDSEETDVWLGWKKELWGYKITKELSLATVVLNEI